MKLCVCVEIITSNFKHTCYYNTLKMDLLNKDTLHDNAWFFPLYTISLSVTKSASATDRRFPATLLHACVFLSQSTHPFHPAHARCGDLSFCRFTDLRTASVPAFQPAQTFMTCLTQSGPCCFFAFFFFFLSTERVDERNIKAPTDTSKRRPTTSEDAWVFFMR